MIDTIAWSVDLTNEQLEKILSKSKEYTEYDHVSGETNFRIVRSNLDIGSFDSNITIKCYETNRAHLEFSVPKQRLGHNVELVYPSQLEQTLATVHASLVEHFGDFPSYLNWYLMRVDLCYAWRLLSQAAAEDALKVLKTFDYPRKSKYLYKDAVMWRGKYFSLKFYLKEPEFYKHDYKKLAEAGYEDLANRVAQLSKGVLRFEITFRKESLNNIFGKRLIICRDLYDKDKLEQILSQYLNKLLLNLDKSSMDDNGVLQQLRTAYANRKALRLFNFYILFNSPKLLHRQMLIDNYSNSTIWRNKSDISKSGVGLPDHDLPSFTLNIPSDLVVNKENSQSCASETA